MQEDNLMKLLSFIQTLWNTCLGFCLGKSYVEKKRFKQQVKHLQQWQRNRYKSSIDVSHALKKGKFIIILALATYSRRMWYYYRYLSSSGGIYPRGTTGIKPEARAISR